jgi:hypothetical protein
MHANMREKGEKKNAACKMEEGMVHANMHARDKKI